MEAITLGFALGVGAALAFKRGRAGLRAAFGWSARQAGWVTSRVTAAVEDARSTARREYQRGRELNLDEMTEVPPPSSRAAGEEAHVARASKSMPPAAIATPPKNGSTTQPS